MVASARLTHYLKWLGRSEDYEDVWRWSVDDPAAFWTSIWDYFEVIGERGERLENLHVTRPSLEEVYLELTREAE